jgi:3-phosphoshikimate 1-carboxyvinyltransferase
MEERIAPAAAVSGTLVLPGDKSISHRYAMLASIAEGDSKLTNYSTGADCQSTLHCLEALGVAIERQGNTITVHGRGLHGLQAPAESLNAGNSGSTIRMLAGILAAQPFTARIHGDESLSRRPMERIIRPLTQMGAAIKARDGKFPPLEIRGGTLQSIDYELPVASAQVKTCVLFAGLYCNGQTTVREPLRTRDHTEVALREFGADIETEGRLVKLNGPARLAGRDMTVPGDLSSAAFFLVAALTAPEGALTIRGVGLNPTRAALLDFLVAMGGEVKVLDIGDNGGGELIGSVLVRPSRLRGGILEKEMTAALIDEIPVLAVAGALSERGLVVRDAAELRVKETDRIATLAENLARMGVRVEVKPDGFEIPGNQRFHAAELESFGDHRIAMACSVAALRADGPCTIRDAEAASVSYAEFYDHLRLVAR